ncbi:NADPH-dependent FMN reductase [Photobacterium phosphoreum]|uniref:NADPH-dependent FMN reductase n=1 Tax=Photobacterium phosphoreum TaxID=659 RepID=A0AAW4ZN33_PHOPO|nr:NAD(P)H-dependent oxidoreductase [Photobacterium phosphoreum]MCD9478507.1 NADPH-dependent FMN reductase [Photobacterium phosphoreum]MCD9483505.1 NADPH-dependent FMN reductase [Photobacterium phosphoreum]MCD9491673.1 NADPH-dependent FMN reductase [Photobacterium phosphoreum]MCF2190938.1 NADPH-dependent FMN reductase [Photobacterium phosphoreum]MCF2302582.1 NADPH-dependent FMN reductase [Photobacterium phosphoreum]
MKLLTFAASSSSQSINKHLATYAASLVTYADIDVLDINDFEMPLYSSDRENESGIPSLAQEFLDRIAQADAIIISFAEHNGSYTAAYKNLFDWASRINPKVYQNKPMVLLATSPGPGGANTVLTAAVNSAPYFAGNVKASLSIPSFYDNFDVVTGKVTNAKLNTALIATVNSLT